MMKRKSRFLIKISLSIVLISLFLVERYTTEKKVDENKYITSRGKLSPLKRLTRGIDYRRNNFGDKVSSIFNEMRALGQATYDDEIMADFDPSLLNGTEEFLSALDMVEKAEKGSAIDSLKNMWKKRSKLKSEDFEKISSLLEDGSVNELLDLARKASEKDYLDFGLDYNKGPNLELAHLGNKRYLMKILSLKSFVETNKGSLEEAVQNLNIALKLNKMPSDDVTMIGQLVDNSVNTMLSENITDLRNSGADLSKTYNLLERDLVNLPGNQLKSVDGERHFFGEWVFDKLINKSPELQAEEMKSFFDEDELSLTSAEIEESYASYLGVMMEFREIMEEPYYINSGKMEAVLKNSKDLRMFGQLLPAYNKIYEKFHKSQSLLKKNLLAMKITEYEKKHGVRPESLIDLNVPADYLIDNVTGSLFIMVNDEEGHVNIREIEETDKKAKF